MAWEGGIPGILRVTTSVAGDVNRNGQGQGKNKSGNSARRRGRKDKEHATQSPVTRTRLTTEHPDWFEPLLGLPHAKNIVHLYDQLMVLNQRNLILIVSIYSWATKATLTKQTSCNLAQNWKNFCYIHDQLQDAFKQLLLEQLKFVCEHKVDVFFWKLLFYNVRNYLKRQQTDQAHTHTLLLIEQAIKFYRMLYDKLMAKCVASSRCDSALKVVAQRLLICLGDLTRYRVNHVKATDYMEAARYYQRAQELVPGNGAPFNQLAVISIYHVRKKLHRILYCGYNLYISPLAQALRCSLLLCPQLVDFELYPICQGKPAGFVRRDSA